MTINWKKPTAQMLGRFQPFHDGHKTLFKEILKKTGQVVIMIRDTSGTDDSNPFDFDIVKKNIGNSLKEYDGKTLVDISKEDLDLGQSDQDKENIIFRK